MCLNIFPRFYFYLVWHGSRYGDNCLWRNSFSHFPPKGGMPYIVGTHGEALSSVRRQKWGESTSYKPLIGVSTGKARQCWVHSLGLASLNNSSRLWAEGLSLTVQYLDWGDLGQGKYLLHEKSVNPGKGNLFQPARLPKVSKHHKIQKNFLKTWLIHLCYCRREWYFITQPCPIIYSIVNLNNTALGI